MAIAAFALITLDEAKAMLDLQTLTAAQQTHLEGVIDGCSLEIEGLIHTVLVKRASIVEKHTGGPPHRRGGWKRLYLDRKPIVSVASIVDDDGNTVDSSEYTIIENEGVLEHEWQWPAPVGRWTVTYSAGLFDTTTDVTQDLKNACRMLVADRFVRRTPESSVNIGDVKTMHGSAAIPAPVKSMLGKYLVVGA